MNRSRRQFLHEALGASSLLAWGGQVPGFLVRSARAASVGVRDSNRVLVVVELTGGNDGLNTVIPLADPRYERARPSLGINRAQVHRLSDDVGLHPALEPLARLVKAGQLSVIQGVGYPNPNRSHFRAMDIWHSATPDEHAPHEGWLGRAVERAPQPTRDLPALHLGPSPLPLALCGRTTSLPSVDSIERFQLRAGERVLGQPALASLAEVDRGAAATPLLERVRRDQLAAYASSAEVQRAVGRPADTGEFPASPLGRKLRLVAQLIDAGLSTSIYYVNQPGYDTHARQAPTHAALLGELGQALGAFATELEQRNLLDRVALVTFSEFGRRVAENASQGTDHGAAGPMFLLSGRVQAGVVGSHPPLDDLDDGDLRFHTDFRRVYATLLDTWLKVPSREVLQGEFAPLALFRNA